jgi:hypothetical protein
MTINITTKQIENIAESLDSGMCCYYNLKTKEIKEIPNFDNWMSDEEPWQEDIDKIEENWEDYLKIEPMGSKSSFQVIVDFIETVENETLKENLIKSINKPKPFRNFKWEIDKSGEFRKKWFDFKKLKYISWVNSKVKEENEFLS